MIITRTTQEIKIISVFLHVLSWLETYELLLYTRINNIAVHILFNERIMIIIIREVNFTATSRRSNGINLSS